MTGSAGARDQRGVGDRRPFIEGEDAGAEELGEEFVQCAVDSISAPSVRQHLHANQQFGQTDARQIQSLGDLPIQPVDDGGIAAQKSSQISTWKV